MKIVKLMLQKSTEFNINLNAKDNFNQTPFHLACKNNQLEVVKFFIQRSAEWNIDLNAVDNNGYTAFNRVCKEGPELIKELIIQNSDVFLFCNAVPKHIATIQYRKRSCNTLLQDENEVELNQ